MMVRFSLDVDMMVDRYLYMNMMLHFSLDMDMVDCYLDIDMMVRFSLDVDMMVICCDNCLAIGLQWLEHLGVGRIMMLQWELEH